MSVKSDPESGSTRSEADSEDTRSFSLVEIPHTDTTTFCKLCFRKAQAPGSGLKLGPLYQYGYCAAHLYCLMFSAGLDQNGSDDEGINGFLAKDIVKEWRRGSMLKCHYCKEKYATVGCVGTKCKKSFHLPCGIENGSLQQFYGNFTSFCESHKPVQEPYLNAGKANQEKYKMRDECGCCTMELEDGECKEFLWTPCCGGWFHRSCIEQTAENAGTHFFKCPLCNNKDDFTQEMLEFGVYVPDRDANWETSGTFDDQLQRHDTCDADTCQCPHGRKFDEEDTPWEIMLCVCCGAQGIHVQCGQLDTSRPRWKCPLCKPVVASLPNKPISVFTRVKRGQDPPNKDFTRSVLENLTFRVNSDYEINCDMHKNRKDPSDPVIVSFKVNGVPAFDIPQPVKLRKDDLDESDKVKNIPCPFDGCSELLSRVDFKTHCQTHRDKQEERDADVIDEHESEKIEDNDIKASSNTSNEDTDTVEIAAFPEDEVQDNNESVEIIEEVPKSEPMTKVKSTEKQSSILSFFKRFSPNVGENHSPNKKAKIVKTEASSPILKTPLREKNSESVISSPVGYFKVDEEISLKSPVKTPKKELFK